MKFAFCSMVLFNVAYLSSTIYTWLFPKIFAFGNNNGKGYCKWLVSSKKLKFKVSKILGRPRTDRTD